MLASAAAWLTLRDSLPQLDGELEAGGLGDTATIERDSAGIPTITASTIAIRMCMIEPALITSSRRGNVAWR